MEFHENDRLARRFLRGAPSGRLLWQMWAEGPVYAISGTNPSRETVEQTLVQLGCVIPYLPLRPYQQWQRNWSTRTTRTNEREELIEYRCGRRVLTERKIDGQVVEFKVKTAADLEAFIDLCQDLAIEPDPRAYAAARQRASGRYPLAIMAEPSPVQKLLQWETGVMGFYYLLQDSAALMEQAIEALQENQRQRYRILAGLDAELILQGENTSTSLISPAYYARYTLPHIKEYCDMAHDSGKVEIVHMCGLLRDLLPLIRETGMDGIHALTTPPVGDVPWATVYDLFPGDFRILGRFNGECWVGKDVKEILRELSAILPRRVFREHPFILLVHTSGLAGDWEKDLQNLRTAIEEYGS